MQSAEKCFDNSVFVGIKILNKQWDWPVKIDDSVQYWRLYLPYDDNNDIGGIQIERLGSTFWTFVFVTSDLYVVPIYKAAHTHAMNVAIPMCISRQFDGYLVDDWWQQSPGSMPCSGVGTRPCMSY